MRQRHLPKIIFSLAFVIAAALSIGFILGYRINITERAIEKRGVLALQGSGKISVSIDDDAAREVQLPYVNTNLTLGEHRITLSNPLYKTLNRTIEARTDQAVIVPAVLAPDISKLSGVQFTSSERYRLFPLGSLLFVYDHTTQSLEMYDNLEHFLIKSPTITSVIPIFPEDITHIREDQFLILSPVGSYLFSSQSGTIRTLPDKLGSRKFFPCLEQLCSFEDNMIFQHDLISLEGIVLAKDVTSYHVDTSRALYVIDDVNVKRKITMGILGSIDIEVMPRTVAKSYGPLVLTSSGLLLSDNVVLEENLHDIYQDGATIYATGSTGSLYTLQQGAFEQVLNLDSQIDDMQFFSQGRIMLQTTNKLYQCHSTDFDFCSVMYTSDSSIQHVSINESQELIAITEQYKVNDSITYSVYALPRS